MAPRIKFTVKEGVVLTLVIASFFLVLGKYLFPSIANYLVLRRAEAALTVKLQPTQSCPTDEMTIKVEGGVVCQGRAVSSTLLSIFDTYQLDPDGKEQMFPFIKTNDASQTIEIANDYLNNEYYVDRYNPVTINTITWDENPYNQQYWRFIFYSLRDEEYLLQAWQETGNPAYRDKYIAILQSFLTTGVNQPLAWDNSHAVAFRTMALVDSWWELREYNALSVQMNDEILQSLEQHGSYLADPSNYQAESNHGVNEASALLLLSVDFPDLPNAKEWQTIAEDRLVVGLNTLVDSDGALIENSPYYHFYTLEKYWQIFQWAQGQGLIFSADTQATLKKMVDYATYILQPNDTIPLWGASIERTIDFAGVDKEIALANPNFLYVLTRGEHGTQPSQLSIHYNTAGQTIMRSGWGVGDDFTNQSQVIFNVGPYRTNHSQLDALAFTIYGQGTALMPGPGLYTYTPSAYRNYFYGTASHNTVVVDGKDQNVGAAVAGIFKEGDGYTYQTGESSLYNGVTQDRAVALLGQDLVLVVDHLKSNTQHTYQQTFHLFPGATLAQNGLDITGYNGSPDSNQQITIHQLVTTGVTVTSAINNSHPIGGVCSEAYEALIPCYQIGYNQVGYDANFVTLLEIGKPDPNLHTEISSDGQTVTINDGRKDYTIALGDVPADTVPVQITNNVPPAAMDTEIIASSSFGLLSPTSGKQVRIEHDMPLDLSDKNLDLKLNITNAPDLQGLDISLLADDGAESATMRLNDIYPKADSGSNVDIVLGKGELRNQMGGWIIGNASAGFDWSNIYALVFKMQSKPGTTATLHVDNISLVPSQSKGSVLIVFDNGSSNSILPAAQVMQSMGLKGNIGVASEDIAGDKEGYLTLPQLQDLQDNYGWNIINESWTHADEVSTYYAAGNMNGLSQDILEGAEYLNGNDINSDPNWFIYPEGDTNPAIQSVVGQYYKFARTTEVAPTAYPYGNPLAVATLANITTSTSPLAVMKAISDAKKYNLTLFLDFYDIQSSPNDPPGFPLSSFEEIMRYIVQQGIPAQTFSELDQSNGVAVDAMKFAQENPEQISLQITPKNNIFNQLSAMIASKF
jgi:hypothetical protein